MPEAAIEQPAQPKNALDDLHNCVTNVQNFLGAEAQSNSDFAQMQTFITQAQGSPEQASSILQQLQQLQNKIFSADPTKALAAMIQTELQKGTINYTNPATGEGVSKPNPVMRVDANIGANGYDQTLNIVMHVPHAEEANYPVLVGAAESAFSFKFPALGEMERVGAGSWQGDTNYKWEFKIPKEKGANSILEALLHGKTLGGVLAVTDIDAATSAVTPVADASTITAAQTNTPNPQVVVNCAPTTVVNNAPEVTATGGDAVAAPVTENANIPQAAGGDASAVPVAVNANAPETEAVAAQEAAPVTAATKVLAMPQPTSAVERLQQGASRAEAEAASGRTA